MDERRPKRFEIYKKKFEMQKKKFEIQKTGVEDSMLDAIDDSTPLTEIEPIEESGLTPRTRENLIGLVEKPLLEACQTLFDKDIKTIFSSANKKDVAAGFAYITIDLESLNPRNRELALSMGEIVNIHGSKPRKGINLKIPITVRTTAGEVRREALRIANAFEGNIS